MVKILSIVTGLSALTTGLFSQEQKVFLSDTVKMEEVVITRVMPLDDNSVLEYYQRSHASGIDEINARLGGVSLISRGAYAMEPVLNSFSGGQINLTIDGMKMFGACTGKMDPITSYVEPVNLKSIELSHGSDGNKNGSTVGGSLDMILRKPEKSALNVEAGVNYKTVSEGKTGYMQFNYGREMWAYRMSGVYKNFSPYTDGNGRVVPFSQFRKINLQQSLMVSPAKGHNLYIDWLIDDAFDIGYPALPMDVSRAKGRIFSLEYSPDNGIMNVSGLKAKLYMNTVRHIMDDSHRDSLYFIQDLITGIADSVYMRMEMPGQSNTWGGFVEGKLRWSERNILSFKVENYTNRSKADMTMFMNNPAAPGEPPMHAETWPENQRQVTGIYLKNSIQAGRKTLIAIDIRVDHGQSRILSDQGRQEFTVLNYDVDKTYSAFVTSANLNFILKLKNHLRFTAGTGYGERLPTLSEQFGFYLFNAFDGYDYIGNPDIRTEKAVHLMGIINFTLPALKISWETHYNQVFDYILGRAKPEYGPLTVRASGVKQYENLTSATIFASNVQIMWQPAEEIEILNILKYNYGQTYSGEPLPLIAPLKNIGSVTWRRPEYYVQAEAEYSSAQHRINADFGESSTASFTLLNVRAGFDIDLECTILNFSFGIENVFDNAYSEHLDWGNYLRPGRNFYLGLSVKI